MTASSSQPSLPERSASTTPASCNPMHVEEGKTGALPTKRVSLTALGLLGVMWFAYFLNYCDRQAVFAMFPQLRIDLGMTDQQLGLTGSIFLWVYALGCPIAGQIGDRFSKRLLVVVSLIIWSAVTAATGLVRSATELLTLRAAMGVSESLFMPTAIALMAAAFAPAQRSRAIATLTTAQIAGTVVGSWYGGWMADREAWRTAFFVLGGVGLVFAIPYFWFLTSGPVRRLMQRDPAEDSAKDPAKEKNGRSGTESPSLSPGAAIASDRQPHSLWRLFRVSTFLILCVAFPVLVFGLWLLYGWLPTFLHDKFELTQADAAFNATLYLQGSTAVGLLAGGLMADWLQRVTRGSRYWLMVVSLVCCAPSLHAIGSSETLEQVRMAAIAFGFCSGLMMGNIFPAAFEVVPSGSRASAVGLLNFFGSLVAGLATLFGGLWKASLGIDRLMTFTAIAYAAAGLLLVVALFTCLPGDRVEEA